MSCKNSQECNNREFCDNYLSRLVKLGYVADKPTYLKLVDSIGESALDMTPIVQAAETTTRLELDAVNDRIVFYNEDGEICAICVADLAALIALDDLKNVDATPTDGNTIVYNVSTGNYENYDLVGNVSRLDKLIQSLQAKDEDLQDQIEEGDKDNETTNTRIDQLYEELTKTNNNLTALSQRVSTLETNLTELSNTVNGINTRLQAIENAIWRWGSDKNTSIVRGNINVYSGGVGPNGLFSRADNQNNDLNFE